MNDVRSTAEGKTRVGRGPHLSPLIQGAIGSIMVLLGSYAIGWLASASPLNRYPLLIAIRTEYSGVIAGTVVLTLGCWILFRAWLRLGQQLAGWPEGSLATVKKAVWAWSAPMLLALPIFSRDVFAYIGQGRLVAAGQDPYVDGISTLNNWFQLGADITWAESETPYGPLYLNVEYWVNRLVGTSPDLSVLLFRLVAFIGVILCMVYVPKIAALHKVSGAKATWISVANPLFLISFVASAHNDSLMIGLALAGTYYAATRRGVLGVVLIAASIGVKPITLVLLPFIGLLWAGPDAGWGRRIRYWVYTAGLVGLIMAIIGWANGYGFGWLKVMLGTGTGAVIFAPVGALNAVLSGALSTIGTALGLPASGPEAHRPAGLGGAGAAADLQGQVLAPGPAHGPGLLRAGDPLSDHPALVHPVAAALLRRHGHPRRLAAALGLRHHRLLHRLRRGRPDLHLAVPLRPRPLGQAPVHRDFLGGDGLPGLP